MDKTEGAKNKSEINIKISCFAVAQHAPEIREESRNLSPYASVIRGEDRVYAILGKFCDAASE